jgi:hypothetical protein|tara:strand:+ start:720 stop:1583 length:864 start_codon:yes stop_codon:yes gene_type:complete
MVRFFNQKEEVISIELTPYGKEQFSKGLFSPAFYAFYDNSVIYDGAYASLTESQNQVTNRIKNETPKIKPTTRFSTTQGSVFSLASANTNAEYIQNETWNAKFSRVIGSSDPNSENAPAWSVLLLQESDVGFHDGVDYKIENTIPEMSATLIIDYETRPTEDDLGIVYDLISSQKLILDVQEINTVFKSNGNFDIEVMKSGSDGTLTPLSFPRVDTELDSLSTTIDGTDSEIISGFPITDNTYVGFYLDISVDNQISDFTVASNSSLYKQQIDRDPKSVCEDDLLEE